MSVTTLQSSPPNIIQSSAADAAAAHDNTPARQRWRKAGNSSHTLQNGAPPVNQPPQGARTLSADRLAAMVHQRDSLILQEYGGESGLASRLRTSLHHGMPDNPQQIQRQCDEFGANAYPQLYPMPFSSFLLRACKDGAFICCILSLWALASAGVAEAAAVAVFGILSIFVASLTYYRHGAQRVLAKNEEMQNILVEVARGGRRIQIPIFHLVVGDIAFLESGERVPADGLLVQDHSLYVDESTITGESAAVHVSCAMPFLLSGGKVIQGSGKMLVTGVGSKTEWGRLMLEPKEEAAIEETPLQVRLNQLTSFVHSFGLAFATLVFLISFIVRHLVGHIEDSNNSGTFEAAHLKLLTLVVVFVLSNSPSLAIALSLTHAVKAMMVDGALVRRLSACETMGSVTTICTDEMGLSTLNQTTTVQTSVAGGYRGVEGEVRCPIRPGVAEAVHKIQAAGIKVRMITGEDLATAKALAADCGISQSGIAIEGSTFEGYTAEVKRQELPKISVMASSSPSQFLSFVRNLRESGEVVAVMAPHLSALNEADIGLSMGRTEAMKESSDIIVLDDNFASLVSVVCWGRSIYLNIQKFIQFQLTVNVAALSFNLIAAVSVGDMPLTAVQLLWVNLIMDTLGALALATEPPTDEELQRPPVQHEEHLISSIMVRGLIVQVLYQVVILLTLQIKGEDIFGLEGPDATNIITTIAFHAFVLCQVFNMANARKPDDWNILKGIFGNIHFVGIMCITLALQVIVAEFLGKFASTVKLSWQHWLVCIVIGFFTWPVALLGKTHSCTLKVSLNASRGPICR